MQYLFEINDDMIAGKEFRAYVVIRDFVSKELEQWRERLEAMYSQPFGRPEIDPVLMLKITLLQYMNNLGDVRAVESCACDVRWRIATGLGGDWTPLHPTSLVKFRARLLKHGLEKVVLKACLGTMRKHGYLNGRREIRVDSTHVLGCIAVLSRLECVRETLRLALEHLVDRDGVGTWEPWHAIYVERYPAELRGATIEKLESAMCKAGSDMAALLASERVAQKLEEKPLALLKRVFEEQFEIAEGKVVKLHANPTGAVQNPNDPECSWSTKKSLSEGWRGSKAQIAETAPVEPVEHKGHPTAAVITAISVLPAYASDNGAAPGVIAEHLENTGDESVDQVHVDAGYTSAKALKQAASDGYDLCGPMPRPPHGGDRFGTDDFTVDIAGGYVVCPAGIRSKNHSTIKEDAEKEPYHYFEWDKAACSQCPHFGKCVSKRRKAAFRTIQVCANHMLAQERRILCKTQEYKKQMKRRAAIEGTNSELKRGYGLRRARYKGLPKTNLQAQFAAAACNICRWARRICWTEAHQAAEA